MRGGGCGAPPAGCEDLLDLLDDARGRTPAVPVLAPDDVALLVYTSGTTGPPKGAMVTHANIVHQSAFYASWFELTAADVILGVAPLFHITGLIAHIALALHAGIPIVLFHRFDAAEALRLAERWHTTFTVGSITVFLALLEHPALATTELSSLTKVASGGAPVSPAVVERFREATGATILNIYGLTETTSPVTCTPLGARGAVDPGSGASSVGVPIPGAEVRIVDLDSGDPVPRGAPGELHVRGPWSSAGTGASPRRARAPCTSTQPSARPPSWVSRIPIAVRR